MMVAMTRPGMTTCSAEPKSLVGADSAAPARIWADGQDGAIALTTAAVFNYVASVDCGFYR